jgi:hypothetical protein
MFMGDNSNPVAFLVVYAMTWLIGLGVFHIIDDYQEKVRLKQETRQQIFQGNIGSDNVTLFRDGYGHPVLMEIKKEDGHKISIHQDYYLDNIHLCEKVEVTAPDSSKSIFKGGEYTFITSDGKTRVFKYVINAPDIITKILSESNQQFKQYKETYNAYLDSIETRLQKEIKNSNTKIY